VTGQAGRSAEGIPQKIPLGISQEFNLSRCMFFSSFILVLTLISVSKGHQYQKIKSILPNLLMSWSLNLWLPPQIVCTSQLADLPLPGTCWVDATSQSGPVLQSILPNPLPGLSRPTRYQDFILE